MERMTSRLFSMFSSKHRTRTQPSRPMGLSGYSTPTVPDSAWCSMNFMLGAGMVIFQPATHKVVLIHDDQTGVWFLPRGRKDIGETLEQTALREAYEESGYRAEFFPLNAVTHAPRPPEERAAGPRPHTEAIYVTVRSWHPRPHRPGDTGGEYIVHWYLGKIAADAVPEEGTGMPNERHYKSYLWTIEDALRLLGRDVEALVVTYAWDLYIQTMRQMT